MNEKPDQEYGYCQDCGAYIDEDTYYVTASGDVFCRACGRAEDERQEEIDAEDGWDGFDFYATAEDIIEGEEYGRYIGPGSENAAEWQLTTPAQAKSNTVRACREPREGRSGDE